MYNAFYCHVQLIRTNKIKKFKSVTTSSKTNSKQTTWSYHSKADENHKEKILKTDKKRHATFKEAKVSLITNV